MNALFSNLVEMWNVRPLRERVLLSVLLITLTVVAFELLVYQPVRTQHADVLSRFNKVMSDYNWLQAQSRVVKNTQAQSQGSELLNKSLNEKQKLLEASLADAGLEYKIETLDQEDRIIAEVKLNTVYGKKLLRWIADRIDYGYLLHSLDMGTLQQGKVSASVRFEL